MDCDSLHYSVIENTKGYSWRNLFCVPNKRNVSSKRGGGGPSSRVAKLLLYQGMLCALQEVILHPAVLEFLHPNDQWLVKSYSKS